VTLRAPWVTRTQVEAAIDVFERAMAAGFMLHYTPLGAPLLLGSERYDTAYGVDLHGCSETICRICMLSWLRQLKRGQATVAALDQPYLEIITGWGKNSKVLGVSKVSQQTPRKLRFPLRPEDVRLLEQAEWGWWAWA
jgi:hypothetical protein